MTMTMMKVMKMVMMMRVLSLVLLLGRGLRHLALQDLLPLLVHVALHAGEGVVPHLAQVRLQVLLLRVVCVATQRQRVRGTRTIRTTSSASPPGSADPGAAPWGHLPPPPPFLERAPELQTNFCASWPRSTRKIREKSICFKGRRCCSK